MSVQDEPSYGEHSIGEPSFIEEPEKPSLLKSVKKVVIGGARSPHDPHLFHKLSLIAFFAWIGLGADGLSSSSYGPEEAFRAMGQFPNLAIFVAIASVISEDELGRNYIIPNVFDERVPRAVSRAVRQAVRDLPTIDIPVQEDLGLI